MRPVTCLSHFLVLLIFISVGCSTASPKISGTDLPVIPRVTLSSSQVTSSQGGVSTAGRFVFTGPVYDALERLRWISRSYVAAGWIPEPPEGSQSKATQVFSQPLKKTQLKRVVTITAVASRSEGSVVVELHSEALASE